MKIFMASDHGGLFLKEKLKNFLLNNDYYVEDMGSFDKQSVDYPLYAAKVCKAILKADEKVFGVLVCSSGIGMSIVANRFKGIRAILCQDEYSAQLARLHNNANVIVFGEKIISIERAKRCLKEFLETPFTKEERHVKRISQIEDYNETTCHEL
jgi:ribose 5-phosphate isomerase B